AQTAQEGAEAAPDQAKPHLIWTGWNAIEWYDPVAAEFMKENPDIEVEYRQLSDYKQQITLLAAGEQCDVIVTRDDDKAGFASAGFIRPVDEEEGVQALVDDMYIGNYEAMVYEGKLYGLPYYTDFHTILYNSRLLEQAGFTEPPTSLNELRDMCLEIKQQGIADYPLHLWLYQESNFKEPMYALVYGSQGEWVDDNWEPICDQPGSVVEQILDWMAQAMNDWQILDSANLEMTDADVTELFQNGQTVFLGANRYDLRTLNDPEQTAQAIAGEKVFKAMLMPGFEGAGQGTVAWTRQYTINATAIDQEAAFRLQYFAGGKNQAGEYWTAKQWHERFGLGFAYQSLATDPDIVEGENSWGEPELFAQQKETAVPRKGVDAPWYSEWDNAMQAEWHKAMLGQVSPSEATKAMADKWRELQADYAG
ncbi:MAG TPA: extracellular solute-binding protein, partial [Caldilineaceae bacterium]|nr:extracellular solute-binding protein [Caldilineaceae bacterium]